MLTTESPTRVVRLFLVVWPCLLLASTAVGEVLSTTDAAQIAAFRAGRTTLNFDELVVPAGPCFIELPRDTYEALGIEISATPTGSDETHVARLPGCGNFGAAHTAPNIIGGGTAASSAGWRETIRFDFPAKGTAIGANSDGTGSNTTLTAYRADGTVIAAVSGNQGAFMGIAEPDIAYALWTWNTDQTANGFSLDNVTFAAGLPAQAPALPREAAILLAVLLMAVVAWRLAARPAT